MKKIPIAKIGKTFGLKGYLKLHLETDFPEQFKKNRTFKSDNIELTIENYDKKQNIVKFKGFNTPEEAKKLTNKSLYSSIEETKQNVSLKNNEYFWFDIIGCEIIENDEVLGKVTEVQRLTDDDYLFISTNLEKPKSFLIPYNDRFIEKVDIENKKIYTKYAKDILENS